MPDEADYLQGIAQPVSSPEEDTAEAWRDGEALKTAYTVARRRFETARDGQVSTYRPAQSLDGKSRLNVGHPERGKVTNAWVAMAAKMRAKGVDPEKYVYDVFSRLFSAGQSVPMPQQLLAENVWKLYKQPKQTSALVTKTLWLFQANLANEAIMDLREDGRSLRDAMLDVIYDDTLALTDLFRFCLAYSVGETAVAEYFAVPAALQYYPQAEHYDMIAKKMLPRGFKRQAGEIYRGYLKSKS